MESLTDVTGTRVPLFPAARRVVSLVPSTTETLFALGHEEHVLGVTRYCIHPKEAREHRAIVGGTKSPNLELIASLEPDLVLANQEENRQRDVEWLRERFRVHVSMPTTPREAAADILQLGRLLGKAEAASEKANAIVALLERNGGTAEDTFSFCYLIWRNPYMAAGRGTFVDAMLGEFGGVNAIEQLRYPQISVERLRSLDVDQFLLSSEPFPFGDEHRQELETILSGHPASAAGIRLVDGELLSWHGARLIEGLTYARGLTRMLLARDGNRVDQ